jgi:hypothetical protein
LRCVTLVILSKAPGLVSSSAAMEPAPPFGRTTCLLEICVKGRAGETLFETTLEWSQPDPAVQGGRELYVLRRLEVYWSDLQRPGGGRGSWWLNVASEAEGQ